MYHSFRLLFASRPLQLREPSKFDTAGQANDHVIQLLGPALRLHACATISSCESCTAYGPKSACSRFLSSFIINMFRYVGSSIAKHVKTLKLQSLTATQRAGEAPRKNFRRHSEIRVELVMTVPSQELSFRARNPPKCNFDPARAESPPSSGGEGAGRVGSRAP